MSVLSLFLPPLSFSCSKSCSLFSFSHHKAKKIKRVTNIMTELEKHVRVYPSVSEFVQFRTEESRLLELDNLAKAHVPPHPRPQLERSGHGSLTLKHSLKRESPQIYGTARVYFVGGEIVGVASELDGIRDDLLAAIPVHSIAYVLDPLMCSTSPFPTSRSISLLISFLFDRVGPCLTALGSTRLVLAFHSLRSTEASARSSHSPQLCSMTWCVRGTRRWWTRGVTWSCSVRWTWR